MIANQITSYTQDLNEKEVVNLTINELKKYRALKVQIENRIEQNNAGVINLFPTVRKEDQMKNELKVRQIERALEHSLDYTERKIVDMKYLSSHEVNDINIYLELGLKKGKFYEKKRAAILTIATALGII